MKLYLFLLACLINVTPCLAQKQDVTWLPYSNNEFHFSINYPDYCDDVNAWVVKEYDSIKELSRQCGTLSFWNEKEIFNVSFGNQSVPIISVIVFDNSEQLDLKTFCKKVIILYPGDYEDNEIAFENFPFGKYNGLIAKYENKAGGYTGINKVLFVEKGSWIYVVMIIDPLENDYDELLASLIKSFKIQD